MRIPLSVLTILVGLVSTAWCATDPPDVKPGTPVILGMFINLPDGHLHAGQVLIVEVKGTSGGTARFDLVDLASAVPMPEVSKGHYVGRVVIPGGKFVVNTALIGHLTVNGETTSQAATEAFSVTDDSSPVSLTSSTPRLDVDQPLRVRHNLLEIRGQAAPFSLVQIHAAVLIGDVDTLDGHVVESDTRADASGHFDSPLDLGDAPRASLVNIRVDELTPGAITPMHVELKTMASGRR